MYPGSFFRNRVEMDKDTNSGQYPESRANHYRLYASTGTNVCEKLHGLGDKGDRVGGTNR